MILYFTTTAVYSFIYRKAYLFRPVGDIFMVIDTSNKNPLTVNDLKQIKYQILING